MQGYFTSKGLALSAKLAAGSVLTISRVVAGSGQTQTTATALSGPCQTLAVNTPTQSGNTAAIPATLAAASASGSYTLRELGVYAKDPDEGEILYKIYRLSQPVDITAGSSMVLRFYLEETVSQDLGVTVTCSPAGLVTEEDYAPVRDRVTAVGATAKTYTMDIGDVQAFLDGLPRLLTEEITLRVSGTLTEKLTFSGFSGCGTLRILADEAGACALPGGLEVKNCAVPLRLISLNFTDQPGSTGKCVNLENTPYVSLESCVFSGNGSDTALSATGNTVVSLDISSVTGFHTAVLACRGAIVCVNCAAAGDFSGNQYGAHVWYGGSVLLGASTPELLGGSSHVHDGGIIAKLDGTLI